MVRKPPRLELDDDRKFQNRFWIVQRVAWLILAAIVIVALLAAARSQRGLERLDQVRHVVLETDGTLSIIPVREE